jgi:hypothetical protein
MYNQYLVGGSMTYFQQMEVSKMRDPQVTKGFNIVIHDLHDLGVYPDFGNLQMRYFQGQDDSERR